MRTILATFCLCFGLASCKSELPSFSWSSKITPFGIPLLKVAFPDQGRDDFAVLRSYNPIPLSAHERAEDLDSCIYEGYLLNENDVHVTLTGCAMSDNFQIQFSSKRLNRDMFNVVNGVVSGIESSKGYLLSEANEKPGFDSKPDLRDLKPLSKDGYIANIKVFYDTNFQKKFGTNAPNVIRRILAHTQHVLKWPSLTTKVIFNAAYGAEPIDEVVDVNISTSDYTKRHAKDISIHSNMFFGIFDEATANGTLGKGISGGACDSDIRAHGLMMMYQDDTVTFARSLAHEFGHNLNFRHDNKLADGSPRLDSKGNLCTGVGSIMDYDKGDEGNKRRWSTCVVEDFTQFINKYPNCMKEVDSTKPPTEVGEPTLSSQECDVSKVQTGINGYHYMNLNGFKCMALCIESICVPDDCKNATMTACENLCGGKTCDGAVDAPPCDLTKFGYDGNIIKICTKDGKFYADCSKGMCVPHYSATTIGAYTKSCMKICGQATCDKMVNTC